MFVYNIIYMQESKRSIYLYSNGEIEKVIDNGALKSKDKIKIDELVKFIYYGKLYYIKKWKEYIPPLKLKKKGEIVIIKEKYDLYDEYDKFDKNNVRDDKYPYDIDKLTSTFSKRMNVLKKNAKEINI